jgi:hypothetical protein
LEIETGEEQMVRCFPNPFTDNICIEYEIAVPGRVTLNVYTMLGQPVAVLIDKTLTTGSYTAQWEAEGIWASAYFLVMSLPGKKEIRKCIVKN